MSTSSSFYFFARLDTRDSLTEVQETAAFVLKSRVCGTNKSGHDAGCRL